MLGCIFRRRLLGLLLMFTLCHISANGAFATGTLVDLHDFYPYPHGGFPYGGVIEVDGNCYGTTSEGGADNDGTVYQVTPSGVLTILHSFAGSDGDGPSGGLVHGSDGNFYGTTDYGGANDSGTVFKISSAGAFATVYSFGGGTTDGSEPESGLVQGTDGNFYGTTKYGGSEYDGTVFKVTPSGTESILHSFIGTDGEYPEAALVQGSDGNFYGSTAYGGPALSSASSGYGTVFKVTSAGVFTSLHSFAGTDGYSPIGALFQGTNGNFYGTTEYGGSSFSSTGTFGAGTVFEMTSAGSLTTLHSFVGTDGSYPLSGLLIGTDGNFYGTTESGGASETGGSAGFGTIYQITSAGVFTVTHSFTGVDGSSPDSSLTQGADGNLYGTTIGNVGTVFKVTYSGELTTIYTFVSTDGDDPGAELTQGPDGDYYGVTSDGGASGDGIFYKITSSGAETILHSFTSADGLYPTGKLLLGTDGNFYGTTEDGGSSSAGTVYKVTPSGDLTTIYAFDGSSGEYPTGSLIVGNDGELYGTTEFGGYSFYGTVFKITTSGVITTIYQFSYTDGAFPTGGLVLGSDGNFYGDTQYGGASSNGTVYKVTSNGSLTTLHSFATTDGYEPSTTLVEGSNGNFYGTLGFGGPTGYGSIFEVSPSGGFTSAYNFLNSVDGADPIAGLMVGSDGNFYGTTTYGGANDDGTIYQLTLSGELTTLQSFTTAGGFYSTSPLLQGSDGNFYGTAVDGGAYGAGTVFRLLAPPGAPEGLTATAGDTLITLSWKTSAGGTSYSVYRGTSSGGESSTPIAAGVSTTTYTDTGLTNGVTYYYVVTAIGAQGTSPESTEASATPLPPAPPAPTGLTATGAYEQVNLSWTGSAAATSYDVYRGTMSGGESTTPVAVAVFTTTYADTGLTDGTTYYYTVAAVDADGTSPASNEASATPSAPIPLAPTGLAAEPGSGSISLTWSSALYASSYNVYIGTSAGGEGAIPVARDVTGTSDIVLGMTNGITYYLKMTAVNSTGEGPPSNEVHATPMAADSLAKGIAFFSSPYDYSNTNLDGLFETPGVTLYVWDPVTLLYDSSPTPPADAVRLGVGYWAKLPSATQFPAAGSPADTTQPFSIPLSTGWNQIGDPFTNSVALSQTTFVKGPAILTWSQATSGAKPLVNPAVWGYSAAKGYTSTKTLQTYQGYFIYASGDLTMQIPPP